MDSLIKITGLELEKHCIKRLNEIAIWRDITEEKIRKYLSSTLTTSGVLWFKKTRHLTEEEINRLMSNDNWNASVYNQHRNCYTRLQDRCKSLLKCSKEQEIYLTVDDYIKVTRPIDVNKLYHELE